MSGVAEAAVGVCPGRKSERSFLIKLLHKEWIALGVEELGNGIGRADEELLALAEEGGYLIPMAGGHAVGAAAGVLAAPVQGAELACGRAVAACGDEVVLPRAIDAMVHIAEGDVRVIALPNEARTGEDVAIHTHCKLALTDVAVVAISPFFIQVGDHLVIKTGQ